MSGIAGLYYLDGRPAEREAIEHMLAALVHRGPDAEGVQCVGPVAFGHRLLHTTPESLHETQPLTAHDGASLLTADARLDNREELIRALSRSSHTHDVHTDADLILATYLAWGAECPSHLIGDFAFAVWDPGEHRLLCVRDHLGIKPLYYVYCPGRLFAFASEIKALLRLPGVSCEPDPLAVAEHLLVPVAPSHTRTFFRDIRALAPGHCLIVTPERLTTVPFWSLDPEREIRLGSKEEYAEAFRELFTEAVRCRLRNAFPVGSLLSGGLDSSSITATAARLTDQAGLPPLHTFSATYERVPESDERPYIQAVLNRYPTLVPTFFSADSANPAGYLSEMHYHLDRPNWAGNLYVNWNLCARARERGIRVLLDGFDGDTTVSYGLVYLEELKARHAWMSLLRETLAYARRSGYPVWKALQRTFRGPLYDSRPVQLLRQWISPLRRPRPVTSLPHWQRFLHDDFYQLIAPHVVTAPPAPQTEREYHYRRLTAPLLTRFNEMIEATGAAFALEPRFPFFDVRLVTFCLALPPELKLCRGWTRFILRAAMQDILPYSVQWRPGKTSVAPGFVYALTRHGISFLDMLCEFDASGTAGPYVNLDTFKNTAYVAKKADHNQDLITNLWRPGTLLFWLRDSRTVYPLET